MGSAALRKRMWEKFTMAFEQILTFIPTNDNIWEMGVKCSFKGHCVEKFFYFIYLIYLSNHLISNSSQSNLFV
jgi:hypothetical protein